MASKKSKKWTREKKADFLRLCKQRVSWAELYAYFPEMTAEELRKRHAKQLEVGALTATDAPVERRISLPAAESEPESDKENDEPLVAGQRPARRGKPWSDSEDRLLCRLKAQDLGWQEIRRHFPERTWAGIQGRWNVIQPMRSDDAASQTPVRGTVALKMACATPQTTSHAQDSPAPERFPAAVAQARNDPALTIREQIAALDKERQQHEAHAKHLEQCEKDLRELQEKFEDHQRRAKELKEREQAFASSTARLMEQRHRAALQEEATERRARKDDWRQRSRAGIGRGRAGGGRGRGGTWSSTNAWEQ